MSAEKLMIRLTGMTSGNLQITWKNEDISVNLSKYYLTLEIVSHQAKYKSDLFKSVKMMDKTVRMPTMKRQCSFSKSAVWRTVKVAIGTVGLEQSNRTIVSLSSSDTATATVCLCLYISPFKIIQRIYFLARSVHLQKDFGARVRIHRVGVGGYRRQETSAR